MTEEIKYTLAKNWEEIFFKVLPELEELLKSKEKDDICLKIEGNIVHINFKKPKETV